MVGAGRVGQVFTESDDTSDGTQGNDRLGVPAFSVKDGPNKVGTSNGCTTTAWLCGTNRAQTWNEDLIYQVGVASGYECVAGSTEMLLGPALNIHRNPLCGRNYEYFSEDPVISGVMASALVKGIQESGCGVTLKHFAANQMEGENNDRWNKLDSVMSERTLREIYLKGFEIVTKTADPTGVMTAYNMVNGKYASCSDELMQIMKEEWGFDGLSMTDWSGDWGNPVTMFQTATDIAMPSNLYMLSYLYRALNISKEENRGLTYQEAGGQFDEGKMLTREDMESCVADLLNTTMKLKVFADYYNLDYTAEHQTGEAFDVTRASVE
jgi:beta-glucosidase